MGYYDEANAPGYPYGYTPATYGSSLLNINSLGLGQVRAPLFGYGGTGGPIPEPYKSSVTPATPLQGVLGLLNTLLDNRVVTKTICCSDGNFYETLKDCYDKNLKQIISEGCNGSLKDSNSSVPTNVNDKVPGNGYGNTGTGCGCNSVVMPVCGSDGITYGSACRAVCLGNTPLFYGNCENLTNPYTKTMFTCSPGSDIVCGDDGVTYENSCLLTTLKITNEQNRTGRCPNKCKCVFNYSPVCGVNGITYANDCFASCAQVSILFRDKCNSPLAQKCTQCSNQGSANACSINDKEYTNRCYLECDGETWAYDGSCTSSTLPGGSCVCPAIYLPVCGVNGKTYDNECKMNCEGVGKKSNGPCGIGTSQDCLYRCWNSGINPVCSNGITFGNDCMLECGFSNGIVKDRRKRSRGQCKSVDPSNLCGCGQSSTPVCGEDLITYSSPCSAMCYSRPIKHSGNCGWNGYDQGNYQKYDFGCNSQCKSKFFGSRSTDIKVPFILVPKGPNYGIGGSRPIGGCSNGCDRARIELPGLGFQPQNPFGQSGFNPSFLNQIPNMNIVVGMMLPGQPISAATNPMGFIPQNSQPTPPIYVTQPLPPQFQQPIYQPGFQVVGQQPSFQMPTQPATPSFQMPAQPASPSFDSSFGKQTTTSTVNFSTQMSSLNIDFSTVTNFNNIPNELKAQFQKAPYLYYMYFYSLIYYKYASAETLIQGIMVKDLLLYIAQTLLNIVPSLDNQAGNTIIAGQGSPSVANFGITGTVQGTSQSYLQVNSNGQYVTQPTTVQIPSGSSSPQISVQVVPGGSAQTYPAQTLPGSAFSVGQTPQVVSYPMGQTLPGNFMPAGQTLPGNFMPAGQTLPATFMPAGQTLPGNAFSFGQTLPGTTLPNQQMSTLPMQFSPQTIMPQQTPLSLIGSSQG